VWDCDETTAMTQMVMTKKGRKLFFRKIGVTPSVAVPGDTNLSEATALLYTVYRTINRKQLGGK